MLWFGLSYLTGHLGALRRLFELADLFPYSVAAFLVLCALAWGSIWIIYTAAARSVNNKASIHLPLALSALLTYSVVTGLAHFWGWVPLPLAAMIASPCLLLPPLVYFVRPAPPIEKPAIALSMEDDCRVKDRALNSAMVRQFCGRYPDAKAYIYRTGNVYSIGGLLLHNRERLNVLQTTWLDVTLDCPFTASMGVLAEGRESFSAFFIRPKQSRSAVYTFPTKDWDEWLAGFTQHEWMQRIQSLDELPAAHPPLGDQPFQLIDKKYPWQLYSLLD